MTKPIMLTEEWLVKNEITFSVLDESKIKIEGYLDLSGTQITALPDNLTVGGYLDLSGTQITALPDNLTVGGSLDLSGTQITALPDNLTVGGSLYLSGTQIRDKKTKKLSSDFKIKLQASIEIRFNHKGWSIADGVLAKVISKKGDVRKVIIAGQKKTTYLIGDDKGNWAHGETIKQAREDLIYKVVERADVKIPKKATGKEWVGIYRAVTGACAAGVKGFVESVGKSLDDEYTAKQILKLVKGKFGYEAFKKRMEQS